MYLSKDELKNKLYSYQLESITEEDDEIVEMAISTAIEEVKSYLTPGSQSEFMDGRLLYDVVAIFSAEGSDRHPLILEHVKTSAVWWITQLANTDIIYEHVKERYDRTIAYLTKVLKGDINISNLPTLDPEEDNAANKEPFRSGSRLKFNHE